MYVNSIRLRELRLARQWSQDQLAELSGLNLRIIQRLESGAKISNESLRALAAVLEVPAESLLIGDPTPGQAALKAMREGVLGGLEFTGTTDAGLSPWWQLISLAPVAGILVLLYLLTLPSKEAEPADATTS